ncbi:MAG: hypothetical protein V4550_07250 [Gemmatimonadota bacterium]
MPTTECRPALLRIAAEPTTATNRKLWRALTLEERERALASALVDGDAGSETRQQAEIAIANNRGFRRQSVARWPDQKIATWAAKIESLPSETMWNSIVHFHMTHRVAMMSRFLDGAGIEHEDGRFVDEGPSVALEAEVLRGAADTLLESWSLDDIVLYLLALRINFADGFCNLDPWLTSRTEFEPTPAIIDEPPTSEPRILPLGGRDFTTLDRRLIRCIVDAAAGVIGAESEEELDDLLLEMEQLNASRHSTFFHGGFRDSMFGRAPKDELPAENETRRRWYWSGYVTGLARRDEWHEIARYHALEPTVRALGSKADGPARIAAELVFRSLVRVERYAEAAAFVAPQAAATSEQLRSAMLEAAVDLIRRGRASEARPLLDSLWSVARSEKVAIDSKFLVEVQRRRALCLRQLGDQREAIDILDELARHDDPRIRAIAHTDIGLIKAGYRRLGDLTLPVERSELSTLIESLERGETAWMDAARTPGFSPAHANFALGVLALAREKYLEADHRLGDAVVVFSGKPDVYSSDGSLGLAQLYLGVSICLTLDNPGRLAHARELIVAGLDAGARVPRWLISSIVESLALQNGQLAGEAASALLVRADEGILDELITAASPAIIPAIRPALFQRASSPSRSDTLRAKDYRLVVPWLLEAHEVDKAKDALGFLEHSATLGIGRTELLSLIVEGDLSPAWSAEQCAEMRIHLLELQGDYAGAAWAVEEIAHAMLAAGEPNALDNAELLLLLLEGYGPAGADSHYRLRGVVEARTAARDREESVALDSGVHQDERCDVLILVVGGNEVHARMDTDIRARIAADLPGVSVEFLHSGWTGNWSVHVEQFERLVARADGVVMLQLMRTMFGRSVRARCHVPWRGCRGRGQGEIVNTVKRVVPAARARLAGRTPQSTDGAIA